MNTLGTDRSRPILFFFRLALRMALERGRALTVLTVVAIAASGALAVAVELASRAVREDLARTADAMVGTAQLEIVGTPRGLPERLIDELASVPGIATATPLISETVRIGEGESALYVLGVDLLAEHQPRTIEAMRGGERVSDPLRLLAREDAVLIPNSLARHLGLGLGDVFSVRTSRGRYELSIQGLMPDGEGVARAYAGQIAVMDVWNLQALLSSTGFVDRVEITLEEGAPADQVLGAIERRLEGAAEVRPVSRRASLAGPIIALLDFAAWAIFGLALLVAALLALAGVSQRTEERERDFALMRMSGMTPLGVSILIAGEALLLTGAGIVLGAPLGSLLGGPLLTGFSTLSSHVGDVAFSGTSFSFWTVAVAAVSIVAIAAIGSYHPIRRTTGRDPLDTLHTRVDPTRAARSARYAITMVTCGFLALAVAAAPVGSATVRAIMTLAIVVAAVLAFGGDSMRFLGRVFRELLSKTCRIGLMFGTVVEHRGVSLAISLAAIAVSSALLVSALTLVDSTISSIDAWNANRFAGAVTVFAGEPGSGFAGEAIGREAIEEIRDLPNVGRVGLVYNGTIVVQNVDVVLTAAAVENMSQQPGLFSASENNEAARRALMSGKIGASHAFLQFFRMRVGDSIELATRVGKRKFEIGAVVQNFGAPTGSLMLDLSSFDRHFERPGASYLVVWGSVPDADLVEEIRSVAGAFHPLFFRFGKELRTTASDTLLRFRSLINGVIAICGLFSGLAVMTVISGALTARGPEFALMRVAGAGKTQVLGAVVADSAALTLTGVAIGGGLGLCLGWLGSHVLFERFGWTVAYVPKFATAGMPVLAIAATTSLLASIPALRALREDPLDSISNR